jgi:hypothetical protein
MALPACRGAAVLARTVPYVLRGQRVVREEHCVRLRIFFIKPAS